MKSTTLAFLAIFLYFGRAVNRGVVSVDNRVYTVCVRYIGA